MKARILAISPYEALQNLIISVAAKRDDVELIPMLGDVSDGDALLERVLAVRQHYDVIISRGGTCRMLEPHMKVPVLEIISSGFDLLRTVRLMKGYEGKFAIVGFPSTGDSARMICDMIDMKINIFIVNDQAETEACIRELIRQNYKLVVGGVSTVRIAQSLGISSLLITSGIESISDTIGQAVRLFRNAEKKTLENRLLRGMLEAGDRWAAIFDKEKRLTVQAGAIAEPVIAALKRQVESVLRQGEASVYCAAGGAHYAVQGKRVQVDDEPYAAFSVAPSRMQESGIQSWVLPQKPSSAEGHSYNLLNGCGQRINRALEQAQDFARLRNPVIVYGETGTGKESMVNKLHMLSRKSGSDLITVNVPNGSRESWKKLLESSDSPLNQVGYGIYFKEAQETPAYIQQALADYLRSAAESGSNRFYFSWTTRGSASVESEAFYCMLVKELDALTLPMPSLRERPEDIPSFLSIVINEYNSQFGKQVFGFEAEAVACLQAYPWQLNFIQFKQLVREAIAQCREAYVTTDTVRALLANMRREEPLESAAQLPLDRTLEEINAYVIQLVLKEENYNYTHTAARLGISRSSLWRKTKNP